MSWWRCSRWRSGCGSGRRWIRRSTIPTSSRGSSARASSARRSTPIARSTRSQYDHDGYYARTGGAVDYHFDQTGGRWIEPTTRDLEGDVGVVVGDSFTFGFGVRYDGAYVSKLEQALQARGLHRHFLNFATPGADALTASGTYLAVRDGQPHDLVLYGLHLNDLIHFPTSYVAMVGQTRDTMGGSRLLGFVSHAR